MAPLAPVLFFDGVCGLCNGIVDFLIRVDRHGVLRYAPLQGETARETLGADVASRLDTVWLRDVDGSLSSRSEAVIRALSRLGGPWRLARALRVVPRPLRDFAYGLVVRDRYRWFGKRETCRLPSPAERARFLP